MRSTIATWLLASRARAPEVTRFLTVGILNSALTFALYQVLLFLVVYRAAYAASFGAGVLFAATMNAHVVFRVRLTFAAFLRFVGVYFINFFLGLSVISLAVERMYVPPRIAPILSVVVLLPVGFLGSRLALLRGGKAAAMGVGPERDPSRHHDSDEAIIGYGTSGSRRSDRWSPTRREGKSNEA